MTFYNNNILLLDKNLKVKYIFEVSFDINFKFVFVPLCYATVYLNGRIFLNDQTNIFEFEVRNNQNQKMLVKKDELKQTSYVPNSLALRPMITGKSFASQSLFTVDNQLYYQQSYYKVFNVLIDVNKDVEVQKVKGFYFTTLDQTFHCYIYSDLRKHVYKVSSQFEDQSILEFETGSMNQMNVNGILILYGQGKSYDCSAIISVVNQYKVLKNSEFPELKDTELHKHLNVNEQGIQIDKNVLQRIFNQDFVQQLSSYQLEFYNKQFKIIDELHNDFINSLKFQYKTQENQIKNKNIIKKCKNQQNLNSKLHFEINEKVKILQTLMVKLLQ